MDKKSPNIIVRFFHKVFCIKALIASLETYHTRYKYKCQYKRKNKKYVFTYKKYVLIWLLSRVLICLFSKSFGEI